MTFNLFMLFNNITRIISMLLKFILIFVYNYIKILDFPGGSVVKITACIAGDAGDVGSTPGSGRSPGRGNGN